VTPESLTPFATEFWIDAGVAIFCGTLFGIERTLRGKQIGLIVCVLVVYGTNLFVALGGVLTPNNVETGRVLGQVVSGIGFLGAGVMFAQGGRVTGVNTAASIWILASVGALVGTGFYPAAIATTFLLLAVIHIGETLSPKLEKLRAKKRDFADTSE